MLDRVRSQKITTKGASQALSIGKEAGACGEVAGDGGGHAASSSAYCNWSFP